MVILFCTACNKKKSETNHALHLNLSEQPSSFDPRLVRSIRDLSFVQQLYEGLMRSDQNQQLQPALASSYIISEEGTLYTFYLKKSFWSNGSPLTAYDFERSMRELLSPDFPSDYAFILFPIKNAHNAKRGLCPLEQIGVKAVSDDQLIIELEKPTPYFLHLTAFPTYFPVAKEKELFSGPFTIKKMEPDYALILEKNLRYWDKKAVRLDEIHFSIIADNHTEALLFEEGALDWLGQPLSHAISSDLLSTLKNRSSYDVAGSCWLSFNPESPGLQNSKIRHAITTAINREELITHVLQGGQKGATSFLPPSLTLTTHEPFFKDGDVKYAKELLQEGIKELAITKLPPLTLAFPNSQRHLQLAQVIQQQLKKNLGIELVLEMKEMQLFQKGVKEKAFDIAYGQWIADYHDPNAFLEIFTQEPFSQGLSESVKEKYCHLLKQASATNQQKERLTALYAAERLFMQERPIAPLYHYCFDYVKKPYVQGVLLSPLGLADFKYAYVGEAL